MILHRAIFVALAAGFAIFSLACSESSQTLTLPEDKWILVESDQPSIYVRFVGVSAKEYLFQCSDKLFEGNNPNLKSMPKKYAMGRGAIGAAVSLNRRTTHYHNGKQSKVVLEIFMRFKVVSYDQAKNSVEIRLLELTP
jgi:hypothetical protein